MLAKLTSKKAIFVITFFVGVFVIVGMAAFSKPKRQPQLFVKPLTAQIFITQQLTPDLLQLVKANGYETVIDLRPDGEAPDETPAYEMERVARLGKLHFSYIPVQHGDIPDRAVSALSEAIKESHGPVLLYCRSGRRAARTWSLMEASRPGGLDKAAILDAVRGAGQAADDLDAAIALRIAHRTKVEAMQ